MLKSPLNQTSFAGGELAPALHARTDLEKFGVALKTCRNFYVRPGGGASNRAGFEFLGETQKSSAASRVIPFVFNTLQAYCLELGDQTLRIYRNGAQVVETGVAVTAVTTNVAYLEFTATTSTWIVGDHAYLIGSSGVAYGPYLVSFISGTTKRITELDGTVPNLSAITAQLADVSTSGTAERVYTIVTPWAAADLFDMDYAQVADTMTLVHPSYAPRELTRSAHSTWTISSPTFNTNSGNIFASTDNYPATVTFFQQRRIFGRTNAEPQAVWGSSVGAFASMFPRATANAADAFKIELASQEANPVQRLLAAEDFIVFTTAAEWRISGAASDAITGDGNIVAKIQTHNGSGLLRPLLVNDSALFRSRTQNTVRDLKYTFQSNKYAGRDVTILAYHLFEDGTADGDVPIAITDWCYHKTRESIIWAARADGVMLGLTYLPEHDIYAWHRHDTDGLIESVAAVPDSEGSRLYAVIKRTINGRDVRYVERLNDRNFANIQDAVFMDSALCLPVSGTTLSIIYGLEWLEAETVSILVGGKVKPQQVVTNGSITVAVADGETICIGMPIQADLEALPLSLDEPTLDGRRARVMEMRIRVDKTRGLQVGSSADDLVPLPQTVEFYDTPPDIESGEVGEAIVQGWEDYGSVFVRQDEPLPATVMAWIPELNHAER